MSFPQLRPLGPRRWAGPLSVLLLLSGRAAAQQPAEAPPSLSPGEQVTVEVGAGSPVVESPGLKAAGAEARGVPVRLAVPEDGPYWIDARSDFFDAYLVLRDEDGEVLAEDDNGWIRHHPRLVVDRLAAGRTYRVEVCTTSPHPPLPATVSLHAGKPPVRRSLDRLRDALADARLELRARQARWSPRHPLLFEVRREIARLLAETDAPAAASRAYAELIADADRVFGDDEVWLAGVLFEAAEVEERLARFTPAERLLERGERILRLREQPREADLARSALVRGRLALDRARYDRALERFGQGERMAKAAGDSLLAARCRTGMGRVELARNAPAAAEPHFSAVVGQLEPWGGLDHPILAPARCGIARVRIAQGSLEKAREIVNGVLRGIEREWDPMLLTAAEPRWILGRILRAKKEPAAAERELRTALRIVENGLGRAHPFTALVLRELALCQRELGRAARAAELLERAARVQESVLGPAHPQTRRTLELIGR